MKDLYKKVVNWQPFFYSNSFWLKSSDVFEYFNLITALLLTIVPLGTDLIIKVLKNEFNGKVEMNELSQYLRKGNLIHDKIPFEIYNSDEIIVEDNIIRLK